MAKTRIDDVAAAAGVAIKTVSRVLNNEPNVRAETRERVLAAVKALNYHPSMSARGLAGRRSYLIGLVYETPSVNYIVDVQYGAMARCRQEHFQLFIHPCGVPEGELVRDILGLIDQTHVDGLVLTPPVSESKDLLDALGERSVPFVRISPNELRSRMPHVDMDDLGAAREMTEYLIGLGHRRIGFVIGNPAQSASARRLQGYRAALRAHQIPFRPAYVRQGAFVFQSGLEEGRALLSLPERPTAIFASNDDMGAGVVVAAHELGISVPGQLSVAGFDDAYISRAIWPALTTVHQPSYDLAYTATDLLLQMLRTEQIPEPVRLPHRLVCRASTAAVATAEDAAPPPGE
jgi:LacI family transcriptional regulator